jgi:hypothetical protein
MSTPAMAWQPSVGSQTQPAYTSVPARTTLVRPVASVCAASPNALPLAHANPMLQAQPAAAEKPKKVEWPDAIKEYVRRAFDPSNAIPGISQGDMTTKLKAIISYYAERDWHDHVDWPTYPLPQELLKQERDTAAAASNVYNPVNATNGSTNISSPALSPRAAKRKSQDLDTSTQASIPPWQKTNNLQDRITFGNGQHKEKRQKKNDISKDITSKLDQADLEKRRQRFQLGQSSAPWESSKRDSEPEMSTAPIVGTNESLEKRYFRLTAPPDPATVRPLHVLEKTLDLLRHKWKTEKNYNYICNQFKSLRQDLTVQHIKNAFTVRVYEIHARIALEKGDLGEYNQCQTQLKALYQQKLGGHPGEFLAYRILYFVYTCNKTDMNDLLAELTPADKSQAAVKHALDVRSALALGNYHKFFKLYLMAPNMGAYLMDMFIQRERFNALANISKAYVLFPSSQMALLTMSRYIKVALRFLTDELGFENDTEFRQFLEECGAQHLVEEYEGDNGKTQFRVRVKEGAALFEQRRAAAFARVDIKGQI